MARGAWAPHLHIYAVGVIGEPGLSALSRPPLNFDEYARGLDDVLDALGLAAASIVGLSLGGWLALDFAIRRSDRVSSLVLIVLGGVGSQRNVLYWAVPSPYSASGAGKRWLNESSAHFPQW